MIIQPASIEDLPQYTDLLQRTYANSYTSESLGLTKECFSKAIFDTPDTQDYLKSNLVINSKQKSWVAYLGSKLIGSITILDKGKEFELRGFYVDSEYQGKGVGTSLWIKAKEFAIAKDVVLDIYAHNTKTIEMYKKWGFIIDEGKGVFYRHWPEWPEGVQAKCFYMRLKQT